MKMEPSGSDSCGTGQSLVKDHEDLPRGCLIQSRFADDNPIQPCVFYVPLLPHVKRSGHRGGGQASSGPP